MWNAEQRKRLVLEHEILQSEGFTQFSVYWDRTRDSYEASGIASSNSGRKYHLCVPIPPAFPFQLSIPYQRSGYRGPMAQAYCPAYASMPKCRAQQHDKPPHRARTRRRCDERAREKLENREEPL